MDETLKKKALDMIQFNILLKIRRVFSIFADLWLHFMVAKKMLAHVWWSFKNNPTQKHRLCIHALNPNPKNSTMLRCKLAKCLVRCRS